MDPPPWRSPPSAHPHSAHRRRSSCPARRRLSLCGGRSALWDPPTAPLSDTRSGTTPMWKVRRRQLQRSGTPQRQAVATARQRSQGLLPTPSSCSTWFPSTTPVKARWARLQSRCGPLVHHLSRLHRPLPARRPTTRWSSHGQRRSWVRTTRRRCSTRWVWWQQTMPSRGRRTCSPSSVMSRRTPPRAR